MCTSNKTGKLLQSYSTETEATYYAKISSERYGKSLTYYHCEKCNQYHLTPSDHFTPSSDCYSCSWSDSSKPKKLYSSEEIAQRRADIIYQENGVRLRVYPCPHHVGYHLTKKNWMAS